MAYLDNPFLVPDDHPVPWTLHIQEEVLVRRQRHEIRFQRLDDGMQPERNRIDLLLSALQPEKSQQSVQHGLHVSRHPTYRPVVFFPFGYLFLRREQFRIAVDCRKRCTQVMGHGQHDSFSCRNQLLVFGNGMFQLPDCFLQPFLVAVYACHVPVYNHVGTSEQQEHDYHQSGNYSQ